MSSLVLILAIVFRKRSFVQRMRLMSRQMRRMRQNVVILAIQRHPGFPGAAVHIPGNFERILETV